MAFRSNIVLGSAKLRQNFGSKKGVKLSQQMSRVGRNRDQLKKRYVKMRVII